MPDMRPALPIVATEDVTRVRIDTRTGERIQELELAYSEYDIGRFREGYCCIECGEAQERPFPMSCPVCAFPMRLEQTRKFAEQFDGYKTYGPSKTFEELFAEDEELKARKARETPGVSSGKIWVPS